MRCGDEKQAFKLENAGLGQCHKLWNAMDLIFTYALSDPSTSLSLPLPSVSHILLLSIANQRGESKLTFQQEKHNPIIGSINLSPPRFKKSQTAVKRNGCWKSWCFGHSCMFSPFHKMVVGISDNVHGLILAISSSAFIGTSFIIKKVGLKRAGASGPRAGDGGFAYLKEPWWWAGMITMLVGEGANFAAYAYAPAVLVTPLGALSIIVSAVLAHFYLEESLHMFGVVGCILCLVGSITIVIHSPLERDIESVKEVWDLATKPGFIVYTIIVLGLVVILIVVYVPTNGNKHMVVYIGVCSLMGSLTVMCVKAVAIALKLSLSGSNQFVYFQTWFFTICVVVFCVMQLVYLNKALDTFNTAVVSPVYYVMFTTLTIVASTIMFQEWHSQDASQIVSELSGFVTILCGTFLLQKTKDMGGAPYVISPTYHRSGISSPPPTLPPEHP